MASTIFQERLKQALTDNGYKQADLTRLTGYSRARISQYINGKFVAKKDSIEKIASVLNVSPTWLMGIDDIKQRTITKRPLQSSKRIPLIGTIACGTPIFADENVEDYIRCPEKVDADFALNCKGDSMINARICDGDIVFIKQCPIVDNGKIAAVLVDDEATLKRFYKYENQIVLQAENPKYRPMVFTGYQMNNIRVLGEAVAILNIL